MLSRKIIGHTSRKISSSVPISPPLAHRLRRFHPHPFSHSASVAKDLQASVALQTARRSHRHSPPSHPAQTQQPQTHNMAHAVRLQALRALMASPEFDLQAYIIPTEDPHQSEYIAACHKRREYITGFSGSAGQAVVTLNAAALWTDGRYFLQASQQLDYNWTLMKSGIPDTPSREEWLIKVLPTQSRVGVDPRLITNGSALTLQSKLSAAGIELVSIPVNLVDTVWGDALPPLPTNPVEIFGLKYAGISYEDKVTQVRAELAKKGCHGLVVNSLDEIAWLFNLRGSDIDFNPVFFSYAFITEKKSYLYIDETKLKPAVRQYLVEQNIDWRPYDSIFSHLEEEAKSLEKGKIMIGSSCSLALAECVGQNKILEARSPIVNAKAIKNAVELNGFRQCHLRDAVALVKYFAWLETELSVGNDSLTECSCADRLEEFRKQGDDFIGLSFDTISSMGPNGSIIHYKPNPDTCAKVTADDLYLCDSGAQYRDGTTDVTRTMHFGSPKDEHRHAFTRVLQGHIALDCAVFPVGTTGYLLDVIARAPLWKSGLDYRHGTGHGVGSYLNVHEGPHGIGTRIAYNDVPLSAGMIVTNEPGYYEDNKFGIRIENIMIIKEVQLAKNFGDRGYLGFEHVTMVPIQKRLIDISMLSPAEIAWINSYHAEIRAKILPLLQDSHEASQWLLRETEPL